MNLGTVALVGLGGYFLWYTTNLGIAGQTIEIVFQGVRFDSLTKYVVTFSMRNVSNVGVTVNAMTGTLYCRGQVFANLKSFTPVTVPARGEVNVEVIAESSVLTIPSIIADIIAQKANDIDFSVQGNANLNGLVVPFRVDKVLSFGI
ncbi:MAG: LEA type 2 family protein [Chitinophagaceae bacterium]